MLKVLQRALSAIGRLKEQDEGNFFQNRSQIASEMDDVTDKTGAKRSPSWAAPAKEKVQKRDL